MQSNTTHLHRCVLFLYNRNMNKQIKICYALLRKNYEPWIISFEMSNSNQDSNYGVKFNLGFFSEGNIKPRKDITFSDWGYTPEEAIEKIIYRIIEDDYNDKKEVVEPAG